MSEQQLALVKELKAAIDARILGRQVSNASGGGRSLSYASTPLKTLIGYYNQMRASCEEALSDPTLPFISPEGHNGERRRPGLYRTRSTV